MHFLHPGGVRVRHVDVDVGQRPDRAAVAAGQRDRPQPACRARRAAPPSTFGDSPLVEIAERDVARPRPAPRSAARTPGRTRSRCATPSACCVSVVSAIAARPARSRSNRPTSSAAKCCASAALPPLPNTSTLPAVGVGLRIAAGRRATGREVRRTHAARAARSPRRASAPPTAARRRGRAPTASLLPRPARAPPRRSRRTPPASPAAARRSSPAS